MSEGGENELMPWGVRDVGGEMQAALLCALVFMADGGEAERHFAAVEARLKTCTSLSGTLAGYGAANHGVEFVLLKPAYVRMINEYVGIYSDGKVQVNHVFAEKAFFRRQLSQSDRPYTVESLEGFFGYATGSDVPYYVKSTTYRMQKVDGRMCAAKALVFESFGRNDRMVFYVDPQTKLPVGWDQVFGAAKMHYRLRELKLNARLTPADFEWKPPPGLEDRTPDPWEGRYIHVTTLENVSIELRKNGDKYAVSGSRTGGSTERIEGVFDPVTLKIWGAFHYKPRGTSSFTGQWVADKKQFELTDDQGDAKVTYYLKRRRMRH